jgi:hypothetical protein
MAAEVSDWIISKHKHLAAVDDADPEEFNTPAEIEALGWITLLTLWGDEEGLITGELADFLSQGPVVIEERMA